MAEENGEVLWRLFVVRNGNGGECVVLSFRLKVNVGSKKKVLTW